MRAGALAELTIGVDETGAHAELVALEDQPPFGRNGVATSSKKGIRTRRCMAGADEIHSSVARRSLISTRIRAGPWRTTLRPRQTLSALSVVVVTGVVLPAFAQAPGTPGDIPALPERSQPPASKSDQERVVGKVLHIDREKGLVKLDSDEGVVVMQPPSQTLNAIRVGDTVSVLRSAGEAPSASPRTR